MALIFGVTANNSNGLSFLHFDKTEDGLGLTLTGKYKGEDIQIDFDELNQSEIEDLIMMLQKHLKPKTVSGSLALR